MTEKWKKHDEKKGEFITRINTNMLSTTHFKYLVYHNI